MSDSEIDKIVIVTQKSHHHMDSGTPYAAAPTTVTVATPPRPVKHEGYDRTGNWVSRTKMTQELAQIINDGLRYYEDDLSADFLEGPIRGQSSNFCTVNVISKE